MGNKVIFITGSNGEMGRYLIEALNKAGSKNIIALDLEQKNNILNTKFIQGSILDTQLLDDINEKYGQGVLNPETGIFTPNKS